MEIFKIQDLTYYYPRKEEAALKEIDLSIKEGEFIVLLGKSGSGKSTLGRVFNKIVPEFYGGKIKGNLDSKVNVGMVFQDPEKQLVMDKVEREIAFGLENIGTEYDKMRKKVMETLSFLNIWEIRDKKTYELSGGQKQKVAIGATLSMGYKFLVLDEPTSQLDPVTAEEILHILKRLNEELGYTIVLIEQRIDRCFHLADRVLFMEEGRLVFDGEPEEFVGWNYKNEKNFSPSIADYFIRKGNSAIPLTIKDGRKELRKGLPFKDEVKGKLEHDKSEEAICMKKIHFTYENGKKALNGLNLRVFKGEVLGVMGENGGGKSTLLKNIAGLLKPHRGKLTVNGGVGYLSQNPNDYLFNDTVYDELKYTLDQKGITDLSIIERTLKDLDILKYKDKNPRDLSGGEKQRVALACILVMEPEILVLDEPTRGLDRELKDKLGEIILDFKGKGKTILLVTHDVEFVGKFCDRVTLIFDGSIGQVGSKYDILSDGIYYTTQMNKLFRGYVDNIITLEDALSVKSEYLKEGAI
ncbi:MAG: ATP-binding cassette domain-containing protein [Marinisporobacter sp.]|jgi:energy-coupling factor transport system ATP-binding protein|nr:ATP-binding cassette domain-containing protein [Marinisporobacter sp.]